MNSRLAHARALARACAPWVAACALIAAVAVQGRASMTLATVVFVAVCWLLIDYARWSREQERKPEQRPEDWEWPKRR